MKGLIYHTLFGFPEKEHFYSGPAVFFVLILFFVSPEKSGIFLFWCVCNFSLSAGSRLQSEKLIGWDRYELTLPVRKSQLILTKYLSYLLLLIRNIAEMLISVFLLSLLIREPLFDHTSLALLFSVAVSLLIGSFIYPFYLMQKDTDSSELLINSVLGALIVIFIVWIILHTRNASVTLISYPVAIVSACVSVVLYLLSYFLSVFYYKNKQR